MREHLRILRRINLDDAVHVGEVEPPGGDVGAEEDGGLGAVHFGEGLEG
jgi:hypothetical protein